MIVPIVSKKSLSMIENVTRTAVSTPSLTTKLKSTRPNVEKSGACTIAWGSRAAPGVGNAWPPAKTSLSTIAITVVPRMPRSRAPRVRRAMSHAVRKNPTRKTTIGSPFSVPRPTGSGPADHGVHEDDVGHHHEGRDARADLGPEIRIARGEAEVAGEERGHAGPQFTSSEELSVFWLRLEGGAEADLRRFHLLGGVLAF